MSTNLCSSFQTATSFDYWHVLMKKCFNRSTYSDPKIQERIDAITKELGENSFTRQRTHNWTPAHVAVLSDNKAGLEFLQLHNALAPTIKDIWGKTPVDYARTQFPHLLHFFTPEEVGSANVKLIETKMSQLSLQERQSSVPKLPQNIERVFATTRVLLTTAPFEYHQNTHDFGVCLKKLLFVQQDSSTAAAPAKGRPAIDHLFSNLETLSTKYGFTLVPTTDRYMPRDKLIRTGSGQIAAPSFSRHILQAMGRADSLSVYQESKPLTLTDHASFHSCGGQMPAPPSRDLATYGGANLFLPFPLEGGNYHRLTNAQGKIQVVIGKDSFYGALNLLRLERLFAQAPYKIDEKTLISMKDKLLHDNKLVADTLCEMYAQGLLKPVPGRGNGFISAQKILELWEAHTPGTKTSLLQQAIARKVVTPPTFSDTELQEGLEIAANYLAQVQRTKEIIATTFCVTSDDLILVPQCDYHLDVFMRPGPKGSMFLHSFESTMELLKEIEKDKDRLKLDNLDRQILQRYLSASSKLHQELGALYCETKLLLEKAGITVIPTPGIFYDISPTMKDPNSGKLFLIETFNLNFLNAISGWSEKANTYFYIASGAHLKPKGRLAGVLMESFKAFMSRYQPNVEVVFIGHKPSDPKDFTEAMQWANFLLSRLGPHCLSFELETTSHRDP